MLLLILAWFSRHHIVCPEFQFPFSAFGREKDRFSFILPKVNAQLVIYILERFLLCSSFIRSRSLCWNNRHVSSREIDHRLQLVAFRLYATEIIEVQRLILLKLKGREFAMQIYMEFPTGLVWLIPINNLNDGIFRNKILWYIVSTAFWMSIKITPVRRPQLKPSDILLVK